MINETGYEANNIAKSLRMSKSHSIGIIVPDIGNFFFADVVQKIEELLFEKTRGTKSEILFTQWSYDKVVIPKALNSISSLFAHYSLHDESHSNTIINNIVRLFGIDSISKLSSIDLWLILESSYYHDIGMVFSGEEFADTIKSDDFFYFFQEIYDNKDHKLNEFAILFNIESKQIKFKNEKLRKFWCSCN